MLSHCLIFLCIGVYVSCIPILPPNLSETIKLLDKIIKKGNTVRPKNESMESVEIPMTLEKECASYNLDKYIKALHLLEIEDSENLTNAYTDMHNILKAFSKSKAITKILKPENENKNCEVSAIIIKKFLPELFSFLIELNHLLKINEGTK